MESVNGSANAIAANAARRRDGRELSMGGAFRRKAPISRALRSFNTLWFMLRCRASIYIEYLGCPRSCSPRTRKRKKLARTPRIFFTEHRGARSLNRTFPRSIRTVHLSRSSSRTLLSIRESLDNYDSC